MYKIYIEFPFVEGPYGGGNQFLKALSDIWRKQGVYAETVEEADIILINSIQAFADYKKICRMRYKNPQKLFVHRIDGPIFLIRDGNKHIDYGIGIINDYLCDASIFQTEWNRQRCAENGIKDSKPSVVICNGSNRLIFHEDSSKSIFGHNKINIIATSWSNNWNKGFAYYQYLDENLDKERFQFIFVGNSPVEFKNSIQLPPVESTKLAEYLQSADIYVTASKKDPCSNSLIEALNCGLPAAVYADGGHPYILQDGGECFKSKEEMIQAIEKIAGSLQEYRNNVPKYDIEDIAVSYYQFILQNTKEKTINRKTVVYINTLIAMFRINLCNIWGRLEKWTKKIGDLRYML